MKKQELKDVLLFRASSFSKAQALEIAKQTGKFGIYVRDFDDIKSLSKNDAIEMLNKIING